MRIERTAAVACALAVALAGVGSAAEEPVRPTGAWLPETTRVTLTLLDVEVADRAGRPIRGLTRKDFTARVDGKPWPIYSVDDLCDCSETPSTPAAGGLVPSVPPVPGLLPPSGVSSQPARTILYFDYSQLQQGGRIVAMKDAKRWIQVTMRTGDEVMLVAFSTAAGLRTLSGFTSDRARLLKAIDESFHEPAFMDPFPTQRDARIDECRTQPIFCKPNALDEYHHGRRSLTALKRFLAGLAQVSGHKTLIFFHENGNIVPGEFYGVETHDQARRLEEVGAEATSSQVAVFPATAGDDNLLGFALADYTGGRFNRTQAGLSALIDDARNRCACIYRVALEPPDDRHRRIYPVTIAVDGRPLSRSYRVLSLPPMDRWLRSAQAVLVNPESAQDLFVTAGLVPMRADKGRWDLKAEVALKLGSLAMLPSINGHTGRWEIGAALVRDEGKDSWEMLGLSEVHAGADSAADTWVVHERTFYGLPKGSYHLAAFVRDRTANLFGGAEATLELPRPGTDGVAGPILMRPAVRHLVSTLPLLGRKHAEPVEDARIITDSVPAGTRQVEYPATLEAMTWICSRGESGPTSPSRYISREGIPLLRFDKVTPEPAGQCVRITDRIDHWNPEPGLHAYHLLWTSGDGSEAASAETEFEVSGPSSVPHHARTAPSSP